VAARQNYEGTHRLGEIKAPVLIAVGDRDTGGSNHMYQAQAMKARLPHAELRILPGQTHGFFWEAPQETNAWIADWVLRHAA
jgi:pimeloyl-ACP methyl ester carboxylesterase